MSEKIRWHPGLTRAQRALVRRMVANLERLQRISPTSVELIGEWCERLIAGESLEAIRPEMDRVLALFEASRKPKKKKR